MALTIEVTLKRSRILLLSLPLALILLTLYVKVDVAGLEFSPHNDVPWVEPGSPTVFTVVSEPVAHCTPCFGLPAKERCIRRAGLGN